MIRIRVVRMFSSKYDYLTKISGYTEKRRPTKWY
jgi:hypothetical protein